jgi:hypothetical protein
MGKNRYKSENFRKSRTNRKEFPERLFFSRFSGFLYVRKMQPISAKFHENFQKSDFSGGISPGFQDPKIRNRKKVLNGHSLNQHI